MYRGYSVNSCVIRPIAGSKKKTKKTGEYKKLLAVLVLVLDNFSLTKILKLNPIRKVSRLAYDP